MKSDKRTVYVIIDEESTSLVLTVVDNEDAAIGFISKYERKYHNKVSKLKTLTREIYSTSAAAFGG